MIEEDEKNCKLCNRSVDNTTFHHLIPKMLHAKKWYKKNYSFEELNKTIELCVDCHRAVHQFIKEKNLGRTYNTLEAIKQHPKIINFTNWVAKQKKNNIKTYKKSKW